jgi:hypothetical protein
MPLMRLDQYAGHRGDARSLQYEWTQQGANDELLWKPNRGARSQ